MSLFSSKKIDRLLKRETLYQLGEIQYVHLLLDSMFVLSTSTYIKAQKLKQLKANMDQNFQASHYQNIHLAYTFLPKNKNVPKYICFQVMNTK